jgi:trimeric autotransporter adhesin
MGSREWCTYRVRRVVAAAAAITMIATGMIVVPVDVGSTVVSAAVPDEPGYIGTFAGNGAAGRGGDGGGATDAQVGDPTGLAVDAAGNVYVSQSSNHVIRRIDPDGVITTIAGTGTAGYSGDGDRATGASLNRPGSLTVGPDGALYVADHFNNAIRRIDLTEGSIDTVVSPTRLLRETTHPDDRWQGHVLRPRGLAFGLDGALYVASGDNWIRRIDLAEQTIGTYAGTGTAGFAGDGGDRTAAQFSDPRGIAFDGVDLLVVDRSNRRVRRIDGATGVVATVLGTGLSGRSDADGLPAEQADADLPNDVLVDRSGAWYVATNVTLVRVGPDGIAGTVAGTLVGLTPDQGDGGPSVLAELRAVALGLLPDGHILAAEGTFTNRVRAITPACHPRHPPG